MKTLPQRKVWFWLLIALLSLFLIQSVSADYEDDENTCHWVLDSAGVLTIKPNNGVSCTLGSHSSAYDWSWWNYRSEITAVHVFPQSSNTVAFQAEGAYAFYGFTKCTDWYGLSYFNTSDLQNASNMFYNCSGLKNTNTIKNWNVANVTNMSSMFANSGLESANFSAWSVSNVENISGMFLGCSKLTSLDLSSWDINDTVTSLDNVFKACSKLASLDLSGWDVSKVTTMESTFHGCSALKSLNLTGWDISTVWKMPNAFLNVPSGLALAIDQYFPTWESAYPDKPYIYNKHSYEDFSNAASSGLSANPDGWVFMPYAVTVTFSGAGKSTGVVTTDSNVMTNAEAYFNAVKAFDSTLSYDNSKIYYQKGKDSTLTFSTSEPAHYSVASVTVDSGSPETPPASEYELASIDADHTYAVVVDKASYTLTYLPGDNDSGDVPSISPTQVPWEDEVIVSDNDNNLAKTGYAFSGWSDGTTIYQPSATFDMPAQNVNLTAQYKTHTYTLSYDLNGGSGTAQTASVKYEDGTAVLLGSECGYSLAGNTLTGWTDDSGNRYDLGSTWTIPAQSADGETITLTAEYTKNQYTVTYVAGTGVTGDVPDPVTADYEASITLDDGSTLSKTGHNFDSWTSDDGTTTYAGGASFDIPADDVTLTAVFTPATYTVNYTEGEGSGSVASDSQLYDTEVTVADGTGAMTKTGYSFKNWKDEAGNIWEPGDTFWMPDHDKTLEAQYTINSYELTYDAGAGSGTTVETVEYDSVVTVKDGSGVSMTGYTFDYWEDADGNQYQPQDTFPMPDEDVTLTAQYNVNSYTVHYEAPDADSGVENLPADELKDYEETVYVADDCGLTKVGHTLTGWKSSYDETVYLSDGTDSFDMPALPNNNDTLTLTAVFTPNTWTLTYTKGSGEGDDQVETVDYGTTINLSLGSGFTKTGYGLTGWTYGTDSYDAGDPFTMPDEDVTMEAVYTLGKYTVYYDIDGASGTAPASSAVTYQTVVTVAGSSTFSKEGHTFVNWADADGNTYEAGDTFPMPDYDMYLTAQYSVNDYTLSYAAGSGTGTVPSAESVSYGTDVALDDGSGLTSSKTGWSFSKWSDGTNTYEGGESFTMPAKNVTMTAQYGPNVHILTYTADDAEAGDVPADEDVAYGTVVTAADGSGLTKTDYVFVYWTDGTNKYASGQTFTMPDEDVTLEAVFAEKEYEVIFTLGSAESGTVPGPLSYYFNDDGTISFILPENTGDLEKVGYTFAGWKDVDTEKIYQPGDTYTLNLAAKSLLTIITVNFEPVFVKNNQEKEFYTLPGAYELPAAFENVTAMPGTGFSALRPTVLSKQPAALEYHKTALELMLPSHSQQVNAAVQVIPMVNGSWAVEWLGSTAGMLEGSSLPGEGPCFIAAHNHLNNTEAGPFWALSSLDVNDRLFVRDADTGELNTFRVYESVQYGPNDFAEMAAKAYGDDAGLVLITCEDEAAEGGYIHRRVVFAK